MSNTSINAGKEKFIKDYVSGIESILPNLQFDIIYKLADVFIKAYENENLFFTMGNGGHGSTASHFVNDLLKHTIVSDDKNEVVVHGKRFKAMSLNDSISTITTWANDVGYDYIFSEQLINWVKKGDIVIGFSASGNSKNIIKAFEEAKKHGAISVAFIGGNGGKMKGIADISFTVPSNNYLFIEDLHLIVTHMLCNVVRAMVQKKI